MQNEVGEITYRKRERDEDLGLAHEEGNSESAVERKNKKHTEQVIKSPFISPRQRLIK